MAETNGNMVCPRDGSPWRTIIVDKDFSYFLCRDACHPLRLGALPPAPKFGHDALKTALKGKLYQKTDDACERGACQRPKLPHNNHCEYHHKQKEKYRRPRRSA